MSAATTKEAYAVVSDGDKSFFETRRIELSPIEGVAPGAVFNAAGMGESGVALVTFAPDYDCGFHNTATPTWMFIMHGQMYLEVSDGDSRTLGPGDVVHFSDSDGQGHRSHVVGEQEVICATAGFAG